MFPARERLARRETAGLLSRGDLLEIMRHELPAKIDTDEDLVFSKIRRIENKPPSRYISKWRNLTK